MSIYIEDHLPVVKFNGLNTTKDVTVSGTTTLSGTNTLSGATTISGALTASSTVAATGAITPTGGVAAAGGFSASARTVHTGNAPAVALTTGTDTAFDTQVTYAAEVFIPANVTVTGVRVLMGTVAGNGNMSVALANSSGTVVASSATTATSGTSTTFTQVAFSTTYAAVGPATYWVLLQGANTSDKVRMQAAGPFATTSKTSQTYGTFTSITPTTAFTASVGPIASLY